MPRSRSQQVLISIGFSSRLLQAHLPKTAPGPGLSQSLAQARSLGKIGFSHWPLSLCHSSVCVQLSFHISPQMLEVTCALLSPQAFPQSTHTKSPPTGRSGCLESGAQDFRSAPRGSQARVSALLPVALTISPSAQCCPAAPPHFSRAT